MEMSVMFTKKQKDTKPYKRSKTHAFTGPQKFIFQTMNDKRKFIDE